jgi:hypothetical protein
MSITGPTKVDRQDRRRRSKTTPKLFDGRNTGPNGAIGSHGFFLIRSPHGLEKNLVSSTSLPSAGKKCSAGSLLA